MPQHAVHLVFPGHMKSLAEAYEAIGEWLIEKGDELSPDGSAVDYGAIEAEVARKLGELEVATHGSFLSRLDVDAPFVRVWGKEYRRVGRHCGEYYCMAGTARVERTLYRRLGERSGSTIDAVSMRAGVVADGWLPRTAQAMAHLMAKGTSREAADTAAELLRTPYSRSSFERVGHAVGGQAVQVRERVEQALIERFEVPSQARSVSVSIDRVSVAMEEPAAAPAARGLRSAQLDEELSRLAPRFEVDARVEAVLAEAKREASRVKQRKVERNFRMAYCATVTLHDAAGESVHTIRYGRMPQGDVVGLMRALARDVRVLRARRPELRVVFLADGAPELWNLYDRYVGEREIGVKAMRLVDYWHVVEYLGTAASLLEREKKSWPGQLRRWKRELLEQAGGGRRIVEELRASGLATRQESDGTMPVGDAIRYLEKRLGMVRYAAARRIGLPIGSGNVEATCKSLVNQRMKRCGSRWKQHSGEEILQLRALYLSDRWASAMSRTLMPLRKPVWSVSREEVMRLAA